MRVETLDKVKTFMDYNPESRDLSDKEFFAKFIIKMCPVVCINCTRMTNEEEILHWIQTNDIDEVMRAKRDLSRKDPINYGTRDPILLHKKLEAQNKTKEVLGYA